MPDNLKHVFLTTPLLVAHGTGAVLSGARSPTLHLLLPMIFGYLWARNWEAAQPLPFIFAGLVLGILSLFAALALDSRGSIEHDEKKPEAPSTFQIQYPDQIRHSNPGSESRWGRMFNTGDRVLFATCPQSLAFTVQTLWHVCFFNCISCLAVAYFLQRWDFPSPDWQCLPTREVSLTLKATRIFNGNPIYETVGGIGRVLEAPDILQDLEGQDVVYRLLPIEGAQAPERSGTFKARGLIRYFDHVSASNSFEVSMADQGIYFDFRRGVILETISEGQPWPLLMQRINYWCQDTLALGGRRAAGQVGISRAMLLGDKDALNGKQKELFQDSGTMHLFAVSGLHVGIVAGVLLLGLRLLQIPQPVAHGLMLLCLLGYVQVIGATPSATRAYIMVLFLSLSRVLLRKPMPFAALIASSVAVLFWQPAQLWSAGFQLSYAVAAAIILYAVPLIRWLDQSYKVYPSYKGKILLERNAQHKGRYLIFWRISLCEYVVRFLYWSFLVSLAAVLASFPLIVHYFGTLTPGAVLLNILLIPLATLSIAACLIALTFGALKFSWLTILFNRAAYFCNLEMEALIKFTSETPWLFMKREYYHPAAGPLTLALIFASLLLLQYTKPFKYPLAWLMPLIILTLTLIFSTYSL